MLKYPDVERVDRFLLVRRVHVAVVGTGDDGTLWGEDIDLEHRFLLRLLWLLAHVGRGAGRQRQEQHQHAAQPLLNMFIPALHFLTSYFLHLTSYIESPVIHRRVFTIGCPVHHIDDAQFQFAAT